MSIFDRILSKNKGQLPPAGQPVKLGPDDPKLESKTPKWWEKYHCDECRWHFQGTCYGTMQSQRANGSEPACKQFEHKMKGPPSELFEAIRGR